MASPYRFRSFLIIPKGLRNKARTAAAKVDPGMIGAFTIPLKKVRGEWKTVTNGRETHYGSDVGMTLVDTKEITAKFGGYAGMAASVVANDTRDKKTVDREVTDGRIQRHVPIKPTRPALDVRPRRR